MKNFGNLAFAWDQSQEVLGVALLIVEEFDQEFHLNYDQAEKQIIVSLITKKVSSLFEQQIGCS